MPKPKPMKWSDRVAKMPPIDSAQHEAITDILDHWMAEIVYDYPKADDAVYMIQEDLKALVKEGT